MTDSISTHSRRDMLKTIAAGGVALLGSSAIRYARAEGEYHIDPRVADIVKNAMSIDLHNHCAQPRYAGSAQAEEPKRRTSDKLPLAKQIAKSSLAGICYTYAVDGYRPVNRKPGDWYQYHLQLLSYIDRLLAYNGIRRALTIDDYRSAADHEMPAIIQDCEGAQWIEGRIDRVEQAYKRGLRVCQLLHQLHASVEPLGDVQDSHSPQFDGLTPFGAEVIRECNRLGIVVDLAHGRYNTVVGALRVAKQPLMVSHTSLDTKTGRGTTADWLRPRLISKDYARAVAESGGLVGLWRIFASLKDYVTALRELADVAGVDHTGIGTDTAIVVPAGVSLVPQTNSIWPDEKGGFLIAVVGEMLKQGFRPDEITKIIGGNFFRLFASITSAKGVRRAA